MSNQNSHNSHIAWREWNDETFAEAKAQDKPILLDIGAVWCHWCHVMDDGIPGDPVHTGTYMTPEVQARIAEHFIPVKVDNDRRPDINARYNMGGWPTTAFLNPNGDMIYGETYVPPSRMISLLDYIADYYQNHRDELDKETARMSAERAALESAETSATSLDPNTVGTVVESIKRNFDFAYGGLGTQPKFPHSAALLLTVEQFAATGDPELRAIVEKTMQGMDSGGMYDLYAGGFFRYSTTRDWSIPHYEKMLEDNAALTKVYALAAHILHDERYLNTVRSAQSWLLSDMRNPESGTFAGSQDADEEEHYYGQPLGVRATMATPYIDRTTYTGWNAMMVSALVARYMLTDEEAILQAAQKTFGFLGDHLQAKAEDADQSMLRLYHYYTAGSAQGSIGLLGDQTDFAAAALDLYEATGEGRYLDDATAALEYILSELTDPKGGFFDIKLSPDAIGELARPKKEIGENAEAALALTRLSAFTNQAKYRRAAERALQVFAEDYKKFSFFASSYARAVNAVLHPALHIAIVGDKANSETGDLLRAAWTFIYPGKTVEQFNASLVTSEELAARGYPAGDEGAARAFVCIGSMCLAPVTTAPELLQTIEDALRHAGRFHPPGEVAGVG